MEKFKGKYRVKSRRLDGFDYTSDGYYFITICVKDRKNLLGEIRDGKMFLSEMGKIVEEEWKKTPKIRENLKLDKFAILPNHFHAIVIIDNWSMKEEKNIGIEKNMNPHHCRNVARNVSTKREYNGNYPHLSKISPKPKSLSTIIRAFKSASMKKIHEKGFSDFAFQPRFFDRIIRNEKELNDTQGYILTNVDNWENDEENLGILA